MRYVRKTVLLAAVLLGLAALPVYSFGDSRIGVGFGIPNYVLIYRPGNFDFKGMYDFTEGSEFVYASGGYRFVDSRRISGPLHVSLGLGLYGKLRFSAPEGTDELTGGLNLPMGVSIMLFDRFLEFFAEIAPGVDLYPKPAFTQDPLQMWAGVTIQMN
jgi:hypothetical protein